MDERGRLRFVKDPDAEARRRYRVRWNGAEFGVVFSRSPRTWWARRSASERVRGPFVSRSAAAIALITGDVR